MYIHFEDWSNPWFLSQLDKKGIPHGNKIIKACATFQDPRELTGKSSLSVVESDNSPFKEVEVFRYEGRRNYTGTELEEDIARMGFGDVGKATIRAVFRFANKEGAEFCQAAMAAKYENGMWRFNHPFDDLDGLEEAQRDPVRREPLIHLDLFFPASLERLRKIVNYENPANVIGWTERRRMRLEDTITGVEQQIPRRNPER